MQFSGHGGEGNLGKGLGDADNGLELTDGDGDGRALIGLLLLAADLRADRDEVVAQLVSRFRRQTGRALTVNINNNNKRGEEKRRTQKKAIERELTICSKRCISS